MPRGTPSAKVALTWLSILLLFCGVHCCGPGRGGGRRRSPRKLTPFVYKQHVPNVAENTLSASGLTEGRVMRDDSRFQNLVPNYNADIIFKDEEGTGADRLMTERVKERLDALAISVMNQWPGVKLRVLEGWDEEDHHRVNSLHYEGRAVDISTSDKDPSKQGMLARLAVESGFDWVYYESRTHIHCSVKSESSARSRLGGCFPGTGIVRTPNREIPLSQIQIGDLVQVMKEDGSLSFSPVIMFLHRDPSVNRDFLFIKTQKGSSITLTPSHLVFVLQRQQCHPNAVLSAQTIEYGTAVLAGLVNQGDCLLVQQADGTVVLEEVVDMRSHHRTGVFAPLTLEGTVVIDGVVASCYAVINSQNLAHFAFLPLRMYMRLKELALWLFIVAGDASANTDVPTQVQKHVNFSDVTSNEVDSSYTSIHWYPLMLYKFASWTLPSYLMQG